MHIGDPGWFWLSCLSTKVFMFPKIFITIHLKILKTVEHTSWLSRNALCAQNWIFICNSVKVTLRHIFLKESLYINTHIINAVGIRVAQWVRSLDLTAHTSPSPIRRGFAPSFVNYKKGALDSQPQVIKLTSCLPRVVGSPAFSTTKTGPLAYMI